MIDINLPIKDFQMVDCVFGSADNRFAASRWIGINNDGIFQNKNLAFYPDFFFAQLFGNFDYWTYCQGGYVMLILNRRR